MIGNCLLLGLTSHLCAAGKIQKSPSQSSCQHRLLSLIHSSTVFYMAVHIGNQIRIFAHLAPKLQLCTFGTFTVRATDVAYFVFITRQQPDPPREGRYTFVASQMSNSGPHERFSHTGITAGNWKS